MRPAARTLNRGEETEIGAAVSIIKLSARVPIAARRQLTITNGTYPSNRRLISFIAAGSKWPGVSHHAKNRSSTGPCEADDDVRTMDLTQASN